MNVFVKAKGLAAMTNDPDNLIEILADGQECPVGRVTFGALIDEAFNDPKKALTKAEKIHLRKYHRWLKTFSKRLRNTYPQNHKIHTDRRYWEWHVSEFLRFSKDAKCVEWFFNELTEKDRRNLVEVTHGMDPHPDGGMV